MASEITFNSEMFMKFVKDLLIRRNEKAENRKWQFVLVFDNNSIHVSKKAKQRFWSTNLPCITIAPYWPCLNPCEKFIGAIKQKIKNLKAEGRYDDYQINNCV